MGLTLFVSVVVIGALILPLVGVLFFAGDTEAPKPSGHRVRQVIGFALVAAAVAITFLPASTDQRYTETWGYYQDQVRDVVLHTKCSSVWQAMLSKFNFPDNACSRATFPFLSIAAGVAAVGMGVAFWGARRTRLLAAVCLPIAAALSIYIIEMVASDAMYPAN